MKTIEYIIFFLTRENVRIYYTKWMEDQAQSLIDSTTAHMKMPAPGMGPPPGMMGGPPMMGMGMPVMMARGPPGMPGMNPMMRGGMMGGLIRT